MRKHDFDAIIVGARCAGAPTGMLLASRGYKVLIVDRASFPSDTLSTHVIQPQGVARLARWGLLDRIVASGCPPIHTYAFHFGPLVIAGSPGTADAKVAYCPRRTVLDEILVELRTLRREGYDAMRRNPAVDGVECRCDDVHPQHHSRPAAVRVVVHLARGERRRVAVVEHAEIELGAENSSEWTPLPHPRERVGNEREDVETHDAEP